MGDGRKAAYEAEEEEATRRYHEKKARRIKRFRDALLDEKRPDIVTMLVDKLDEAQLILHRLQLHDKGLPLRDHEDIAVLRNKLHELVSLTTPAG